MIVFNATWQRIALGALLIFPVILVILLMSPALLILPFGENGREFILDVMDKMTTWLKILAGKQIKT
ncbi:hypothetical protein [Sphaerisporangium aureirubrum]|uniref:Uncharacterized protein n=1 Tax=Sphaerisporangium aureirubrum TaxID=1544736 RepID=A0ABW1N9Y9_9ACTN